MEWETELIDLKWNFSSLDWKEGDMKKTEMRLCVCRGQKNIKVKKTSA
jgi:hypothetical protein